MRLRLLLALAFLPLTAKAAQLSRFDCVNSGGHARCTIELVGEVSDRDRLFLSRVHDRDTVSFRGRVIGSTGNFLGHPMHAGFFPRVYPLNSIKGEIAPTLILEAEGGLMHSPGIPRSAKVKIIDEHYPLIKILGPAALQIVSFLFLVNLLIYLFHWLREREIDGWIFPTEEMRWFHGGLGIYLLLRHEVAELAVPLIWSAQSHLLAQRIALAVSLWALSMLLLQGQFSDRSSIVRSRPFERAGLLAGISHLALIFALLAATATPAPDERQATKLLLVPALILLLTMGKAIRSMEWRRLLKRSSVTPFAFYLSLLALPLALVFTAIRASKGNSYDQQAFEIASWAAILLSGLRMRAILLSQERNRLLVAECRDLLIRYHQGNSRLQALCDFIADEWSAARVSIISVEEEFGMVLASGGPESIPAESRTEPKKLGPFLRRACKQNQMLYAPVAEELGHELQTQGLKHSSLAIPLLEADKVRAVLCMMVDEGERIPPRDATQLELLVESLALELLASVAQNVEENRNRQLLSIALQADALAVENLDHWGHLPQQQSEEVRLVLGGDCIPSDPFFEQLKKSLVFGRMWAAYRAEVRNLWIALATSFEFIPKDNRDDFWVIAPRSFKNPFLQTLGPERSVLLLANILEKHARAISGKECYRALGFCGVRLAGGALDLRKSSWHSSAVEVDSEQFALLLELRQRAFPGTVLYFSRSSDISAWNGEAFACRTRPWLEIPEQQIYSILSVAADKKETRKLENLALEKARDLSRKAA